MKRLLYLTNIEVPYRVRFFNELTKYCDLTVLYEKRTVEDRNDVWAKSTVTQHKRQYLRREGVLFSGILKELRRGYDIIIIGCYNTPVQILAMLYMRLCRIPYIINLDGEPFLKGNGVKTRLKRIFLSGAEKYLVAGEKAAHTMKALAGNRKIVPYHFSSLSETEIAEHRKQATNCKRDNTILVIGQYFAYKGMDVALEAARIDQTMRYRFVGMGNRTDLFINENDIPPNVEIIPFLQKKDLEEEYKKCAMLVLPSRKECWGLVINEAASFGTPIVSTWGSGAAVEFLADRYPQYLAKPGNAEDLYKCIQRLHTAEDNEQYACFLLNKTREYFIEKSVQEHIFTLQ